MNTKEIVKEIVQRALTASENRNLSLRTVLPPDIKHEVSERLVDLGFMVIHQSDISHVSWG